MTNTITNLENEINTKSILLITEDIEYKKHIKNSSIIKYDLVKFDKRNISLLSNIIFDYNIIIFDNKNNDLNEFIDTLGIKYLHNFNIPIIVLDDELSLNLTEDKFPNIFSILPRDINNKICSLNIKLCINYIDFNKKIILKDGFYFDMNLETLLKNKKNICLTNIEKKLVKLLIKNIDSFVSYETIEDVVWKDKKYSIYGLRNAIKAIRKKTEETFIINSSNLGYMIEGI